MYYQTNKCIPVDHPSLAGHFPGHPIVPGVVILDEIILAFADWRTDRQIKGIVWVKFLQLLLPGQNFTIGLSILPEDIVKFECRSNDRLLVKGQLKIAILATKEIK